MTSRDMTGAVLPGALLPGEGLAATANIPPPLPPEAGARGFVRSVDMVQPPAAPLQAMPSGFQLRPSAGFDGGTQANPYAACPNPYASALGTIASSFGSGKGVGSKGNGMGSRMGRTAPSGDSLSGGVGGGLSSISASADVSGEMSSGGMGGGGMRVGLGGGGIGGMGGGVGGGLGGVSSGSTLPYGFGGLTDAAGSLGGSVASMASHATLPAFGTPLGMHHGHSMVPRSGATPLPSLHGRGGTALAGSGLLPPPGTPSAAGRLVPGTFSGHPNSASSHAPMHAPQPSAAAKAAAQAAAALQQHMHGFHVPEHHALNLAASMQPPRGVVPAAQAPPPVQLAPPSQHPVGVAYDATVGYEAGMGGFERPVGHYDGVGGYEHLNAGGALSYGGRGSGRGNGRAGGIPVGGKGNGGLGDGGFSPEHGGLYTREHAATSHAAHLASTAEQPPAHPRRSLFTPEQEASLGLRPSTDAETTSTTPIKRGPTLELDGYSLSTTNSGLSVLVPTGTRKVTIEDPSRPPAQ